MERIPIAADHAGFEMKEKFVAILGEMGYEPVDRGTNSPESTDYPTYARAVAEAVSTGEAARGILLCGSGVGMDIVANRYPRVRAALSWSPQIAELSRKHNNSNVLVLPARFVTDEDGVEILKTWLRTDFEGGRHSTRVDMIDTVRGT